MGTLLDMRDPGRQNNPSFIAPKEKEVKRYQNLITEMFLDNLHARKNIIKYRKQYQGIDNEFNYIFGYDNNRDAQLQLPGLTSMMIYNFTEIIASRLYSTFVNDFGDYVRVLPQKLSAIEPSKALTHLLNYYLRQNKLQRHHMYQIFRGVARDGVAISEQSWNYKQTIVKRSKQPRLKYDSKTDTLIPRNDLTIKESIVLADRPEMRYIDPLFFGVQKGGRFLNVDANMCCHKDLFSRSQLEALERRGYIGTDAGGENFSKLTKDQIGNSHTTAREAPELAQYYNFILDEELNRGIKFEDKEYRFMIDKFWIGADEDQDVKCIWLINGIVVRNSFWDAGHEIPYTIYNYILPDTTWTGIGVAEVVQDYYREDNFLTRKGLALARMAGNWVVLLPKSMNIPQNELSQLTRSGGVFQYQESGDGLPFSQKAIQWKLGDPSNAFIQQRDDVRRQAEIMAQISQPEIPGGDLGSAFRSGRQIAQVTAQTSRPAGMRISLIGEDLSIAYEQLKTMVHTLQEEQVEVLIDESSNKIIQIDTDLLERLPDTYVRPFIQAQQLHDAQAQIAMQLLPFIQAVSTPVSPDQAYNFRSVIDTVAESVLGPEAAKNFSASIGTGMPQIMGVGANNQVMPLQAPPGQTTNNETGGLPSMGTSPI